MESGRKQGRGQNDESEAKKGRTDPPTQLRGVVARGATSELPFLLHGTAAARKFGVADRVHPRREGRLGGRLALPQFRPDSMRWPVVRQALNGLQRDPNPCRGSYTLLLCGRYCLARKKEILAGTFDVENDIDWSQAITSPPGQDVAIIRRRTRLGRSVIFVAVPMSRKKMICSTGSSHSRPGRMRHGRVIPAQGFVAEPCRRGTVIPASSVVVPSQPFRSERLSLKRDLGGLW